MNAKELKEFKNWFPQHNLHTEEGGTLLRLNGRVTGLCIDDFGGNCHLIFRRVWCAYGLEHLLPELRCVSLYLADCYRYNTIDNTVSLEEAKQITIDMLKEVLDVNKKSIDNLMQKQKELDQVIKSMEMSKNKN